jgi:anthranilate phosphoribosyltransferase
LPESADAASTAEWTRRVLDKQIPLPTPLANQLACCLYASGHAADLHQAKAMVAVEACSSAFA